MQITPGYLFVYGTLLPGLAPPIIADVVNQLRVIGDATVPGNLYDLGDYPGCTIDENCNSLIHGKLLEIPDPAAIKRLDDYECCVAHDTAGSLFLRKTCQAELPDGRSILAWVYVYNRDLASARLIQNGRYESRHIRP